MSLVNGHIKEHNNKFTLSAVKVLTYGDFRRVGPEQWRKNISCVRDNVEDHYWIAGNLQKKIHRGIIICVGGESDVLKY